MNTFCERHQNSIKFGYHCFDRILLNGLLQPFQQPERVIGFFNAYREGERVTRNRLRDIAEQFQNWVKNRADKWGAPILEAPQALLGSASPRAAWIAVLICSSSFRTGPFRSFAILLKSIN